ncbi:MAG: urease accessory protein UreF [Thiotrichales bacterium]
MPITTTTDIAALARLRLLHLVSPSLPTGAFAYSQGLEWTVECGWVATEAALGDWLSAQLQGTLSHLDLPVLQRMQRACARADLATLEYWVDYLVAGRETAELRAEEQQRGRALTQLLAALALEPDARWAPMVARSQLAGFAYAANIWAIPQPEAMTGYAWSWLENQVLAGVKLIPLGQSAGQRVLLELAAAIPAMVAYAAALEDDDLGGSAPAATLASCHHETQYTRLFRS